MSAGLGDSVRRAVMWRSGSQVFSQLVAWTSTLMVIRILDPADYGLFAMAEVVLVFLMFLNGYGFAGSLVKEKEVTERQLRQAFGMLLLVNAGLAAAQVAIAPLAADYYRQPLIADLLRTQALIFLATPFIALPEVMLMRKLDFRTQAYVGIAATLVSASVALGCALAGMGVWTLIYAPIALFWTRAIGLMAATRLWIKPSFRFAGARGMFNFGLAMILLQLCWIVMTKADAFLAARVLSPHDLGLYTEGLFLTALVATKFVPPLNEVAFPAYARIRDDKALLGASFLKAVRLIMLLTCPLYFGLSAVASDAVGVVLGEKWLGMAGLVTILGCAMPAVTLYILFGPAINATGRVDITARAAVFGAVVMPIAYFAGLQWGATGLAVAWLAAFPLLPLVTFLQARGLLGISGRQMAAAIAPGLLSSAAMAVAVMALAQQLGGLAAWQRLIAEVAAGGLLYAGILLLVSRETVRELVGLIVRRQPPAPSPA
jgi:O-antigen/teichoic acid export membrane protein